MARFIINPKVNNTLGLMDVITVPQGGTGVTVAESVPGVFNAFVGSDLNTANGPIGLDGNGKIPVQYFPTGAGGVLIYDNNGFVPNSAISPSSGVGVFTGITGPSSVVVGETVTYTITNYDSFTNYNVTVSGGSVSVSGNLIAFTAPNTTGTVTLTLNGKTSSIPVIASRVNAPVITAPGNNAEGVSLKPTFTKSAFSVTGQAQTQTSVRWELSTDPAFTTLVDYYEGASNYTSWTPSVTLSNLTTYYVRVKDQGSISGYSAWSPAVSFTTVQQVNFVTVTNAGGDQQYRGLIKLGTYLYAVGYQSAQGQGGWDCIISKYDTNGNLIWHRCLGGAESDEMFEGIDTDGTYLYVAGRQSSQGQGGADALLVKYDTNGNVIWQKGLGKEKHDTYVNITIANGYIYVVGHQGSQSLSGNYESLVVKYDMNGNLIWQRALGGVNTPRSGIVSDGSNIYVVGTHGEYTGSILKYDTNGNLIWQRSSGYSNSYISDIVYSGGYIYFVGRQASQGQGGNDAYIAKCDTNGVVIWQRGLGGSGSDRFLDISIDGSYLYTVGYTTTQSLGGCDALVAKYDIDGNLIWQRTLGSSTNDLLLTVTVQDGCIYTAGSVFASSYNDVWARPSASGGRLFLAALPTSGDIALGALTGTGLTGLSWKQSSLTAYTLTGTYSNTSFTAYTPTLTAYTPTVATYTPTFTQSYSNF
jgi:hypothetical protein